MKPHLSAICAVIGIVVAFTISLAGIRTLVIGISSSRQVISLHGSDPSQLSAVIGETIIAFICRGIIAIIPAMLIYLALAPLRERQPWFYTGARLASYCLLLMFPFGTLFGIILLVMLRRRQSEFARALH